ncbi:abortive phage infection protein [Kribbella antibiotica]|uniref:Abortive phage infection protein n=1 Tax=Kribbella antibiotica TaxID=190195 RepID=A0A4R4YNB0_9ACTN|nr:abortive phage infection protein [Kribbella antibiotica]TDD45609.1 abortive phage infection protein [Kribbella antibiotica]
MSESRINRRTATLGLLAGTVGLGAFPASAAAVPHRRPRLAFKGVAYDAGTGFLGDDSRMRWSRELMRGEVRAIKERLHANWVSIYGSDVERLVETATEALHQGLAVSIQPRAFDEPQADALAKLREVAIAAERLRRRSGPEVIVVVGCEFMLFTPGIVPGANFFERVEYLTKGEFDIKELQRKFRAFTAQMVKVARRNFHGRITYGAAHDLENVDWALFDIVGLDFYGTAPQELVPFRRWGKPIMILEFGCCTFTGAPELGGMGWDIVDFSGEVPVIPPQYTRDEQAQADHLTRMLEVFANEGFLGASMYTFISPDAPHRPKDRPHDEDIAAFSLCKVIRKNSDDPASPYRWEPKKSFHAVARYYANH